MAIERYGVAIEAVDDYNDIGSRPDSVGLPDTAPAQFSLDASGNVIGLVSGDGISFLRGALESGSWATVPSIFRLRLTGTGTVVMDSRDSLGVETLAVESYTLAGATNQIEVLYAGDAVAIRITLSGTAAAEVI